MSRCKMKECYTYCTRYEVSNDKEGKFVKDKSARQHKGVEGTLVVRCKLVAHALGYRLNDEELYAGTPASSTMGLLLS